MVSPFYSLSYLVIDHNNELKTTILNIPSLKFMIELN